MQAPKCKLCGEHHWSRVCPKPTGMATAKAKVAAIEAQPKPTKKPKKTKKRKAKKARAKPASPEPTDVH